MDLNVALTTSKFMNSSDVQWNNIPVCVVNCSFGFFNFGIDLEREENKLANLCESMAKTVYIDSSKKFVFIGKDPKDPDTALVEYTEKNSNPYEHEFFVRWDKLHILIFEFTVYNLNKDLKSDDIRFVLKGIWRLNHWSHLKIDTHNRFQIE